MVRADGLDCFASLAMTGFQFVRAAPKSAASNSRQRNRAPSAVSSLERAMDRDIRIRRIRYRAWHRGTREADFLIGGFFDRCHEEWSDGEMDWFEELLEEQDVDIMAWAIGTLPVPDRFAGPMMERMKRTDYIDVTGQGA
jgi:antitoxin CptB